jgi:hypothetical protein
MIMRLGFLLLVLAIVVTACGEPDGSAGVFEVATPSAEELIEEFDLGPVELEDIQFVADEEGWTLAEAINRIGWQQGFAIVVQELRETYPHQFAGAAILFEEGPRDVFIAFRSSVPEEVRGDPRLQHLNVDFREMLGFSESELTRQTSAVHYAMREAGFPDVVSAPDIPTGIVDVFAVRREADRGKSDQEIIAGLPLVVRADNVRMMFVDDLPGSDD